MFGYWNYYDKNFDWGKEDSFWPNFEYTIKSLQKNGVTQENAIKLYNSGFVCLPETDVLIDRFYGGALSSIDLRTRFFLKDANDILSQDPCSYVEVQKVNSMEELKSIIVMLSDKKKIIFRGQTQNHFIKREINNPYMTIKDYGEISLLPSLWRKMYNKNPQSFNDFTSLTLLEWSNVFYSAFDLEEIERRHKSLNDSGGNIFTMSDMEDCSDEMLREFGKFRLDLAMGMDYNLATTLTTLLQHYGLLSPVLDLTESLEIALFFATHKFERINGLSTYKFVGTNNRQSVLYLIDFNKNEMARHNERDEFLKYLDPQRPFQQRCVVCPTNRYSINLPAFYLRKVLILDFDTQENLSEIESKDIFPNKARDKFLNALFDKILKKEEVTVFDKEDLIQS